MSEAICRLCGELKEMTFEHIPPRSAFNDNQKLFTSIQDHLDGHRYKKYPRGIGKYSLCQECNNLTLNLKYVIG